MFKLDKATVVVALKPSGLMLADSITSFIRSSFDGHFNLSGSNAVLADVPLLQADPPYQPCPSCGGTGIAPKLVRVQVRAFSYDRC
jgi:hypothetical protein